MRTTGERIALGLVVATCLVTLWFGPVRNVMNIRRHEENAARMNRQTACLRGLLAHDPLLPDHCERVKDCLMLEAP
jgi:alkanesulfonate monooxygenase SsuD/methylene tetrahydromethanopterin reductase-like flavin-dependent oxidoreductase (luciferase family)